MKPIYIIFCIVFLIIILVRIASTCSKNEGWEKHEEFTGYRREIQKRQFAIFAYDKNDTDSIDWMAKHIKLFEEAIDSSVKYYRDNYYNNERRYRVYLKTLDEYKKISDAYSAWIKYVEESAEKKVKDTAMDKIKYVEYQNTLRSISFNIQENSVEIMSMDY